MDCCFELVLLHRRIFILVTDSMLKNFHKMLVIMLLWAPPGILFKILYNVLPSCISHKDFITDIVTTDKRHLFITTNLFLDNNSGSALHCIIFSINDLYNFFSHLSDKAFLIIYTCALFLFLPSL